MSATWPVPSPSYRRRVDGSLFVPAPRTGVPNARQYARRFAVFDGQKSLIAPLVPSNEPRKRILATRKRLLTLLAFGALILIALICGYWNSRRSAKHDSAGGTEPQGWGWDGAVLKEVGLRVYERARGSVHPDRHVSGEGSVAEDLVAQGGPSAEKQNYSAVDDKGPAIEDNGVAQGSGRIESESIGLMHVDTPTDGEDDTSEHRGVPFEIRGEFENERNGSARSNEQDGKTLGEDEHIETEEPRRQMAKKPVYTQDPKGLGEAERIEAEHSEDETRKNSFSSKPMERFDEGETDISQRSKPILSYMEDGIETYVRSDIQEGERALCRISNACVLSNGVVSVPDWMKVKTEELRACGLGPYVYHGSDGSEFAGARVRNIEIDLLQPIRRSRLVEPPSTMTEFLMDFVLSGAFAFDVFSASEVVSSSAAVSKRCLSTPTGTDCTGEASADRAKFKPGMLVASSVSQRPESWEAFAAAMLGKAYGGGELQTILVTDVVDPAADNTPASSATCFRSIFTTEFKLRELPSEWFLGASRLFSASGLKQYAHVLIVDYSKDHSCSLSVKILQRNEARRLTSASQLETKLLELSNATRSDVTFKIQIISDMGQLAVAKQIETVQDTDILVGGTSHSLSNLVFMRPNTSVFEVSPFAWQPTLYEELAKSMGVRYNRVIAAPQDQEFRACLDHELVQLRKQNKVSMEETPTWMVEIEGRWQKAVEYFAATGKSSLVLNPETSGISNFHTRSCARRQSLEFKVDEVAYTVLEEGRRICGVN